MLKIDFKWLNGVKEYAEGMPVNLQIHENGRWVVVAYNQNGFDCVFIDAEQLLNALMKWKEKEKEK